MKQFIPFLGILFLLQCATDLRQVPPPTINGNTDRIKSKLTLVIGKFEILSADRGVYTDAWRKSFKGHLQSAALFSNVITELEPNSIKEFYTIDIEMKTNYDDKYNWWISWPALWPFTAIWPIQYRIGEYSVEFQYKLFLNQNLVKEETIVKKGNALEYLYGFYQVRKFQRMVEETNLEAVNTCIKSIEESL
ncbi:hypothetical protein LEP1GSC202_1487 [Leptospira yanagawae serovar Saopaulo str. Sao Paulo = ATCC 700523]|uniref:Lipoprotein n=2 Tax=Leptospira yanagawae TaxID=293069 RepID=A0ABY2M5C9_9LEPT|nr:hypothetical protein [Leptospira yanagawae]EOQ89871.1 hypothetical protein LEP1GSC202_1487 [Leptospira yanagawae serovar Saopaulo str. Sao Paulo = ATCC 700523]TGL24415.1 hypothetical protein EHQ46_04680 [Leptospira yanagawae]